MAIYKGLLASQYSGKVAGTVFSHNRGGNYVREFRTPTNPSTAAQQEVRNAFGMAAIRWRDVLTPAMRESWDDIAHTITAVNALGDPIQLTGQQAFMRAQSLAWQLAGTLLTMAPSETGDTAVGNLTATIWEAGDDPTVTVAGAPDWAGSAAGRIGVYWSRIISPGASFYAGPWRLHQVIPGNATPVTSLILTAPAGWAVGTSWAVRLRAYYLGRISPFWHHGPRIVAPT